MTSERHQDVLASPNFSAALQQRIQNILKKKKKGVGGLAAGFIAVNVDANRPDLEEFVRIGVNTSTDSAKRQMYLPSAGNYAVIVSDQRMPGMTGVELLRKARTVAPNAIRVLLTGYTDLASLVGSINQGEITRSFQESVSPEEEIHVGTVREVQGVRLAVKTLKSDQNRTLHRGYLYARNVSRVFADVAHARARPGAKVKTRQRGAGPWGNNGARPSNKDKKPRGLGSRRS